MTAGNEECQTMRCCKMQLVCVFYEFCNSRYVVGIPEESGLA